MSVSIYYNNGKEPVVIQPDSYPLPKRTGENSWKAVRHETGQVLDRYSPPRKKKPATKCPRHAACNCKLPGDKL